MMTREQKQAAWDAVHMRAAFTYAQMSKCAAKKVACILVKDGAVISIGVNGTAPGAVNCCDKFVKIAGKWHEWVYPEGYPAVPAYPVYSNNQQEHHMWSNVHEIHAEDNALGKAARAGFSTDGSTAYVTHSPCKACAKALVSHGIRRICFIETYDAYDLVKEFLDTAGVEVKKMEVPQ